MGEVLVMAGPTPQVLVPPPGGTLREREESQDCQSASLGGLSCLGL